MQLCRWSALPAMPSARISNAAIHIPELGDLVFGGVDLSETFRTLGRRKHDPRLRLNEKLNRWRGCVCWRLPLRFEDCFVDGAFNFATLVYFSSKPKYARNVGTETHHITFTSPLWVCMRWQDYRSVKYASLTRETNEIPCKEWFRAIFSLQGCDYLW